MRLVDTNFIFNTLKSDEEDVALEVIDAINANDSVASLNLILNALNRAPAGGGGGETAPSLDSLASLLRLQNWSFSEMSVF